MKSRFLQSLAYILPFVLKVVAAGVFLCIVGGISLPACIAIVILLAWLGLGVGRKRQATLLSMKLRSFHTSA